MQIHPTTLYSEKPGRKFLISESVRGEGAVLYNEKMERFVDELLPRDLVTSAIEKQMEEDGKPYVWLSMEHIPKEDLLGHFPNICQRCLEEGYDVTKECIPVVPGQHYFMGGIRADLRGRTSMEKLYAQLYVMTQGNGDGTPRQMRKIRGMLIQTADPAAGKHRMLCPYSSNLSLGVCRHNAAAAVFIT